MRISDWSSDVCSSDLDIPPAELKSDPARLADEAAATSMFGAGSLIRVTNIGDESVDAVSALLESAAAGNPVLAYAGALRKDSKLLKLVEGSPLALHFASYRSEEHTSELQSLMRISYAVFCLKKKTTRT